MRGQGELDGVRFEESAMHGLALLDIFVGHDLAIVLDARVVSAPSINETTFQRDQIEISGDLLHRIMM